MSARIFTPNIKVEHVVSFSDAVFAFAITLMALSIDIPELPLDLSQSQLLDRLSSLYPQLEDYIISFAIIAMFWVSYHRVFNHIEGSYMSIVYLNLLFLLLITLLSLPIIFGISIIISFIDLDLAQYFWLGIIPLNVLIRYKYKH